jgi:hypothetical protein
VKDLVRVIEPPDGIAWSLATETAAQSIIGVGLNFNDFAIAYMNQHAAADGTKAAPSFLNDF